MDTEAQNYLSFLDVLHARDNRKFKKMGGTGALAELLNTNAKTGLDGEDEVEDNERKFGRSLSFDLRKVIGTPLLAKVIRRGQFRVVSVDFIVPGDLCILEAGDEVMTDGVIVECADMTCDEMLVEGARIARKSNDRGDVFVYAHTTVLQGWATVLAVGVGLNTLFELLNQEFLERVRIEEEELAKASGSSHSPALGKHAHGASGILSQNGSSSSPQSKVPLNPSGGGLPGMVPEADDGAAGVLERGGSSLGQVTPLRRTDSRSDRHHHNVEDGTGRALLQESSSSAGTPLAAGTPSGHQGTEAAGERPALERASSHATSLQRIESRMQRNRLQSFGGKKMSMHRKKADEAALENWKHEHEYKFVDDRLAEVKNPNHIGALLEKLRERTGERYLCIQSSLLWKSRMTVDSISAGRELYDSPIEFLSDFPEMSPKFRRILWSSLAINSRYPDNISPAICRSEYFPSIVNPEEIALHSFRATLRKDYSTEFSSHSVRRRFTHPFRRVHLYTIAKCFIPEEDELSVLSSHRSNMPPSRLSLGSGSRSGAGNSRVGSQGGYRVGTAKGRRARKGRSILDMVDNIKSSKLPPPSRGQRENGTEPSRTTLKLPPLSGETLTPESLAKLNSGGDQGVSGDSVSGGGGGGGGQVSSRGSMTSAGSMPQGVALPFVPHLDFGIENAKEKIRGYYRDEARAVLRICGRYLHPKTGEILDLSDRIRDDMEDSIDHMESSGLFPVGLAYAEGTMHALCRSNKSLIFLCVLGIRRYFKEDAREAMTHALEAGVSVYMLSEDSPLLSATGAQYLGILEDPKLGASRVSDLEAAAGRKMTQRLKMMHHEVLLDRIFNVGKDGLPQKRDLLQCRVLCNVRSPDAYRDIVQLFLSIFPRPLAVVFCGQVSSDADAMRMSTISVAFSNSASSLALRAADVRITRTMDTRALIDVILGKLTYLKNGKPVQPTEAELAEQQAALHGQGKGKGKGKGNNKGRGANGGQSKTPGSTGVKGESSSCACVLL